jgi:hypothetical protein
MVLWFCGGMSLFFYFIFLFSVGMSLFLEIMQKYLGEKSLQVIFKWQKWLCVCVCVCTDTPRDTYTKRVDSVNNGEFKLRRR